MVKFNLILYLLLRLLPEPLRLLCRICLVTALRKIGGNRRSSIVGIAIGRVFGRIGFAIFKMGFTFGLSRPRLSVVAFISI
jgi:hypothetical protein